MRLFFPHQTAGLHDILTYARHQVCRSTHAALQFVYLLLQDLNTCNMYSHSPPINHHSEQHMPVTHPVNRAVLVRWEVPLDLQGGGWFHSREGREFRGFTAGRVRGVRINGWGYIHTDCVVCGRGAEGGIIPHHEQSKLGAVLHSYPGCMLVAMGESREEYWSTPFYNLDYKSKDATLTSFPFSRAGSLCSGMARGWRSKWSSMHLIRSLQP